MLELESASGHSQLDDSASSLASKAAPPHAKLITVFDNPENYNIKHPLQHSWCLFHRSTLSSSQSSNTDVWSKSLKPIHECSTIEDFW